MFKITVVGLGLMGGSLAMALRGFKNAHIIGVETNEASLRQALDEGVIDAGYMLNIPTAQKAFGSCDICIICIYPQALIDFLKNYGAYFKNNSIVSDICGVKTQIIAAADQYLPETIRFVGAHPMAGRELSGYDAAVPTLFNGCNYIFTPVENTNSEAMAMLQEIAVYVGAGKISMTTPENHDKLIAYTSQLAHVVAASVVKSPNLLPSKGFEGGSFRDLTRVATLNENMWSELFLLNQEALCEVLENMENEIRNFRDLIKAQDKGKLEQAMAASSALKEEWKIWKP